MPDSRTPEPADISHCSGVLDDALGQLGAHASEPAYERIAADLRAAIGAGRLQPGDRLPTERDHARRYQVAVGTYRHALAVLRQEGWITTHKRHGTVVVQREANQGRECDGLARRVVRIERQVRQLAQQIGQAIQGPAVAPAVHEPAPWSGRPASAQVAEDLRKQIWGGRFPPSSQLPSYAALMQWYGVSISVVRAAIRELTADGLVYSRGGNGVSVRHPLLREQTDVARPWPHMPEAAAVGERPPAGLWVGVLGPVVVVGPHGPIGGHQADLLLALALASPGGLPMSTVQVTLGTGPKQPKSGDSVRQLISRARRQLGLAPDDRDWIQCQGRGHSHLYRLHDAAVLDWARFLPLAERGMRTRNREDLATALALVRGEPFTGYSRWWLGTPLIETIRATVIHATAALSAWEVDGQH